MAKGKAKVVYVDSSGDVRHKSAPTWDFIYAVSLTKDPDWNIGDRVVLPDGREYRYARADGACYAGQGCEFTAVGFNDYQAADVAQAIGDRQVTIPDAATHAIVAEDALRGGYVMLQNSAIANNAQMQVRGIVGNDAAAADAPCVLYLDGALTTAVVIGTTGVEAFQNPYAAIHLSASSALAKAGVPASYVSTTLMYFFVQIKGPCFLAPQAEVTTNDIGCVWRHDGSLDGMNHAITNDISGVGEETSQYAGHRILGTADGNGPLFMLSM